MFVPDEIRFSLEEGGFQFLAEAEVQESLYMLIELLGALREAELPVFFNQDFMELPIGNEGLTLCDLFYDHELSFLDLEQRQALAAALKNLKAWEDYEHDPDPVPLPTHKRGLILSKGYGYSREQSKAGRAHGCVMLHGLKNSGSFGDPNEPEVFALTQVEDMAHFFRFVIDFEEATQLQFASHAPLAYPTLYFHERIWQNVGKLGDQWHEVRPRLREHLSMLNDHFKNVFHRHRGYTEKIIREISATSGIKVSLESTQTMKNKKAMKDRDVTIGREKVRCEWHTKLWSTHGRIHFHPGNLKVASGSLIVAIFCDHLAT